MIPSDQDLADKRRPEIDENSNSDLGGSRGESSLQEQILIGLDSWLGKSRAGFDVWRVAKILAAFQSADYLTHRMLSARAISSRAKIEILAPKLCTLQGLCLEFGVAAGTSINRMAPLFPGRTLYGFDGFEGLPEAWRPDHPKGMFAQAIPQVADNVELVVGWFEETLPVFVEQHDEDVSIIHIDCDLYSSTRTVFKYLSPRIKPGTLILFDEYFNDPGWKQHEYRAFQEFVTEMRLSYEYVAFVRTNKQVLVRIV